MIGCLNVLISRGENGRSDGSGRYGMGLEKDVEEGARETML